MSAAAIAAGTSSIGIRPWNVTASAIAELAGRSRSGLLGVAPAVDVEPDASSGRSARSAAIASMHDVHLVRRRQRARVHEPTSRPSAGTSGAGMAAGSNRASDGLLTTTSPCRPGRPSPTSRSAIAWFTVMTARRERDRHPLLQQQQAVGDRVRGAREAAPEELRHRLVEVEEDRHADEPERQAANDEEVRQGVDLDQRRSAAADGRGRAPTPPGRGTRGTRPGSRRARRPGGAGRRGGGPDAVEDPVGRRRRRGAGRRRRPARPAATSASASRRTRGSSS